MSLSTQVTGLDHVYLAVTEMDRSEAFYDRVMKIRDHWEELTEFEDPLTKAGLF